MKSSFAGEVGSDRKFSSVGFKESSKCRYSSSAIKVRSLIGNVWASMLAAKRVARNVNPINLLNEATPDGFKLERIAL
jgi:hypothetical protein